MVQRRIEGLRVVAAPVRYHPEIQRTAGRRHQVIDGSEGGRKRHASRSESEPLSGRGERRQMGDSGAQVSQTEAMKEEGGRGQVKE